MKALQIDRFGPLADLRVREVDEQPLPADCVRVGIEAAGVNPSDTGVALGKFGHVTLPRILGRDFAGTVVEGPASLLGARLWGSGGSELGMTRDGSHAETMILPVDAAIRRPDRLSAEAAAVAGVPFVTAWSALVDLAGFREGEWVIVGGAAGAVGTAAVSLIEALGGRAIGLVLSKTDLAPLAAARVEAVLRSDVDDVPAAVKELTGGRGADIAINAVGASLFAPLSESLRKGGRMVIFSVIGGREVPLDLFAFYRRRLQFFGLDTAALSLNEIAQIYQRFNPYFASGALQPPQVAARYALDDAAAAYEAVAAGGAGKLVLIPGEAKRRAASGEGAASQSKPDAGSPAAME